MKQACNPLFSKAFFLVSLLLETSTDGDVIVCLLCLPTYTFTWSKTAIVLTGAEHMNIIYTLAMNYGFIYI